VNGTFFGDGGACGGGGEGLLRRHAEEKEEERVNMMVRHDLVSVMLEWASARNAMVEVLKFELGHSNHLIRVIHFWVFSPYCFFFLKT